MSTRARGGRLAWCGGIATIALSAFWPAVAARAYPDSQAFRLHHFRALALDSPFADVALHPRWFDGLVVGHLSLRYIAPLTCCFADLFHRAHARSVGAGCVTLIQHDANAQRGDGRNGAWSVDEDALPRHEIASLDLTEGARLRVGLHSPPSGQRLVLDAGGAYVELAVSW